MVSILDSGVIGNRSCATWLCQARLADSPTWRRRLRADRPLVQS